MQRVVLCDARPGHGCDVGETEKCQMRNREARFFRLDLPYNKLYTASAVFACSRTRVRDAGRDRTDLVRCPACAGHHVLPSQGRKKRDTSELLTGITLYQTNVLHTVRSTRRVTRYALCFYVQVVCGACVCCSVTHATCFNKSSAREHESSANL